MDDAGRESVYEVDWCDTMSHGQTDYSPLTSIIVAFSLTPLCFPLPIPIVLVVSYLRTEYSERFREG